MAPSIPSAGMPASAGSGAEGVAGASGGSTAAGSIGNAGGGSTGAGGAAVKVGTLGEQADPGQAGDGTFEQGKPYTPPNETRLRREGVPVGSAPLSPQFYESKGVYPGLKFEYYRYVPAQYEPGKPAALMVFQDGNHYLGLTEAHFNSHYVFDNMIAAGEMPVTISLFVNPGSESASGVYQYPGEQGVRSMQYDTPSDRYSKFLLDELIPDLILSQYDIVSDPEGWAISGHSSGGICAFMASWYRPDKFRKVLTHNASFANTGGAFPSQISQNDPKPLRVYLLSSPNDIGGWFSANNAAAAALEAKGYHYRYLTGEGMHFPPVQGVADYVEALRWLWRGYSLPWYNKP